MRYRALFRDSEFSGMYVADVLTMTGTYLSRLAVAVLVYDRTSSVGLTALTFAISYAPYVFAPILSTLADRLPRKHLLVLSDVSRALLVLLMVIPGVPLWLLWSVLFTLELIQIPFGAARLATLADILEGDRFAVGNALVASTRQALQVAGFAIGGAVVAATSPRAALLIDSFTYSVSAVIILIFVRHRPLSWTVESPPPSMFRGALAGIRFVTRTPGMKRLFVLLGIGPAIIVIAEGLAVPFSDQLGGGTRLAGIIMAAAPVGNVIGYSIAGRLPVALQQRMVFGLAAAGGATVALAGLAGIVAESPIPVIVVLVVSGATLAYLNAIQVQIANAVPRETRGRVFGLGNAAMQLAQGGAVALAGLLAESSQIGTVLIVSGVIGIALVLALAAVSRWRDARQPGRVTY
ncbi:MAG: MFS transporter [Nocardioidaceae bacterium]